MPQKPRQKFKPLDPIPGPVDPSQLEYGPASLIDEKDLSKAIKTLGMMESSDNYDAEHEREMDPRNVNYEHKAAGKYGIMPYTAAEISKNLDKKDPKVAALRKYFTFPAGQTKLKPNVEQDEVTDFIKKDPELQEKLIRKEMIDEYLRLGDYDKAVYAHRHGYYADPTEEDTKRDPYTKEFGKLKNTIKRSLASD